MVKDEKVINSDFIVDNFGLDSKVYRDAIQEIKNELSEKIKEYKVYFKRKNSFYKSIYDVSTQLDLFLKQIYYFIILRAILTKKLKNNGNYLEESFFKDLVDKYKFDSQEFFELLSDKLMDSLQKKILNILNDCSFSHQDLFHSLYQQIFFPILRHKLGEYYTSQNLVKMMVEDFYELGKKVLDPACGSGGFLVEIFLKILYSNYPNDLKKQVINNVYGFDINPLAVLTTKVNLLCIFLDFFEPKDFSAFKQNIVCLNALFPTQNEKEYVIKIRKKLQNSFDLIIGNPPWLTYKDLSEKNSQAKIRDLAESLKIKPLSQYITHIELATIFFYAIPQQFLKINGKIFFVITKSVLNGDHCYKFRKFSAFDDLEIWDFPEDYFFNVNHICLKAHYIGENNNISPLEKYPITAKLFNEKLELQEKTQYTSIKIEKEGAKVILPISEVKLLNNLSESPYKKDFYQGATLVPKTLVFFKLDSEENEILKISSDLDIVSRAKKNWIFKFKGKTMEKNFKFKTFLNKDLIPFFIKDFRNVFLPITDKFEFNINYLKKNPRAFELYNQLNKVYQDRKKPTSKIETLFANLNYWNKLSKQINNKKYIVVYNASGSIIKASVIDNYEKNIIISSENYYFSTNKLNEAYYLSSIYNSPILTKNIKLIKSSRHIHKRPFSFPIPVYDNDNLLHRKLATKGRKYETLVQDMFFNNPKITIKKIRIFLFKKLEKLDQLTKKVVFGI